MATIKNRTYALPNNVQITRRLKNMNEYICSRVFVLQDYPRGILVRDCENTEGMSVFVAGHIFVKS